MIANVKELSEFMWSLEKKYSLLNDLDINGINPWTGNRIEIYYMIGIKFNIFKDYSRNFIANKKSIRTYTNILKNSFLYSKIFSYKKVDYLVFSSSRSKFLDGELVDIYTKYLIEEIEENGYTYMECEGFYGGKHDRKYTKNKIYLDYIALARNILNKFYYLKISEDKENILNNIQKEFDNLNIDFNIKLYLISQSKKMIVSYYLYRKLLKKMNPKIIYVIVGYGRAELIKAAKDLNIKTIEFQHGTFSKYHLGYSYPNYKGNVEYFPDAFWVWNEYWKNLIDFPILKENIKIYPFRYLEEEKKKYNTKKIKNQMVVLCQGGLTDKMAKKVLDNLELFQDKKLVFKLHPGEYGRSDLYKNLIKLLRIKLDIEIVEDVDLYNLLAESEYQAGVFSTALYEGVEFGCKTILFDLPGIEYMDKFIEMYEARLI